MLRFRQAVLAVGLCVAVGGVCGAQIAGPDTPSVSTELKSGTLVVWVVHPETGVDRARAISHKLAVAGRALPSTVVEKTTGDFGQSSGTVGQVAGSYGTTTGNLGTAASDVGQTAGSYGTSPSSVGTNASDHGQTAGSYGQTAGSFGTTSSNAGHAAGSYEGSLTGTGQAAANAQAAGVSIDDRSGQAFFSEVHFAYPRLSVQVVDVGSEELRDNLAGAEGTKDYPDVLVAVSLPTWLEKSGLVLSVLGLPNIFEPTKEVPKELLKRVVSAMVLKRAPHLNRAQAFAVWMRERDLCRTACERKVLNKTVEQPARVAADALYRVLQGDALGDDADVDAAKFSAVLAQQYALLPPFPAALAGLEYRVDVIRAEANERLAVVIVRGVASSPDAIGVVHAGVALRKNENGLWKVLQISPNVAMWDTFGALDEYARTVAPEKVAHVVGISQAAPVDDDNRQPQPDLWWDNGGGAELLAVEWQIRMGPRAEDGFIDYPGDKSRGWMDSRMVFIEDRDPRVQTRVKAEFARFPDAQYRWRVWSVGVGGVLKLSPWRRLNIVP